MFSCRREVLLIILIQHKTDNVCHYFGRWFPCSANGNSTRNDKSATRIVKPTSCYDEPAADDDASATGIEVQCFLFTLYSIIKNAFFRELVIIGY